MVFETQAFSPKQHSVFLRARLLLLNQLYGSSSISQFGCIPQSGKTVGWKVWDTARPAQMETIPTRDLQEFSISSPRSPCKDANMCHGMSLPNMIVAAVSELLYILLSCWLRLNKVAQKFRKLRSQTHFNSCGVRKSRNPLDVGSLG